MSSVSRAYGWGVGQSFVSKSDLGLAFFTCGESFSKPEILPNFSQEYMNLNTVFYKEKIK